MHSLLMAITRPAGSTRPPDRSMKAPSPGPAADAGHRDRCESRRLAGGGRVGGRRGRDSDHRARRLAADPGTAQGRSPGPASTRAAAPRPARRRRVASRITERLAGAWSRPVRQRPDALGGDPGWLPTWLPSFELISVTRPLLEHLARQRLLERSDITVHEGVRATGLRRHGSGWQVMAEDGATFEADRVIDASGRSSGRRTGSTSWSPRAPPARAGRRPPRVRLPAVSSQRPPTLDDRRAHLGDSDHPAQRHRPSGGERPLAGDRRRLRRSPALPGARRIRRVPRRST